MAISMLKIRRPLGRLIFNMGIAIPGKTVFLIETAPRYLFFVLDACEIYVIWQYAFVVIISVFYVWVVAQLFSIYIYILKKYLSLLIKILQWNIW